ncbi:caffeine-induced death protein 2 [Paraphysoderma sedebokerense]|nr:caffeine-induced death protein 2 [Paraphysoderma sedebokerense]
MSINLSVCSHYSAFKNLLKGHRKVDDNIQLALNSLPSNSDDECKGLFEKVVKSYEVRDQIINGCIKVLEDELSVKEEALKKDQNNYNLQSEVFGSERKLRLVKNELEVEDILRDRTIEIFRARCPAFSFTQEFENLAKKNKR